MNGIHFTMKLTGISMELDKTQIEQFIHGNCRITRDETQLLHSHYNLLQLADIANRIRHRLHPENIVSYVSDRNINYTNICDSKCRFCAFYKNKGESGAYVLPKGDFRDKIKETIELGGSQILLQGGMNPDLGIDYYIDLLSFIKQEFKIHIHGFSPPEIVYISEKNKMSIRDTILKLKKAGLGSIPGGGAEILVDSVREKISPGKCNTDDWINVMRIAHKEGLKTTATMMFGHIETLEDIIEHLFRIRDLQDETGGFTAFIPWTFQPANTKINVVPATSGEYLKILSLSRIVLDNIKNIQASWVTQGEKIAQTSLFFGANDFGSTMIEENVVAAADVSFKIPEHEIIRQIETAGFTAMKRDCFYNYI